MSDRTLFEKIRAAHETFSAGQRDVARFIMTQYDKAAFLSAAEMGEQVGVSESTVIRFALHLGYEGFPEMKRDLQQVVKTQLSPVARVRSADRADQRESLPARVIEADIANLNAMLRGLDFDSLRAASVALARAQTVSIVAARSALAVATFLSFNLNWIRSGVRLVTPGATGELTEQLFGLGPDDAVVAITIPRYTRVTVEALRHARSLGCKTIAITDTAVSPLARAAEIVLGAGTHVESFADSFVGPLSLANALLAAVSLELGPASTERLQALEHLWRANRTYIE